MKRRRRSKVSLWFAESRYRYDLKRQEYLAAEAWLATTEGEAFLAEWRASLEDRRERLRLMLENPELLSDALKRTYPDNFAPAPLWWKS